MDGLEDTSLALNGGNGMTPGESGVCSQEKSQLDRWIDVNHVERRKAKSIEIECG